MIKQTTVYGKSGMYYHGDSGDLYTCGLLEGLEELRELANVNLVVISVTWKTIGGYELPHVVLDQGAEMFLVGDPFASHG